MKKIKIKKSPTADTRTCDVTKVSSDELLSSSKSHIWDVRLVMAALADEIEKRARNHDHTKISHHDDFYKDFKTGFKTQDWYDMHKATERHHLQSPDGVREDVDLIDVLECVVDCVTAGLARSGGIRPLEIPAEVLLKAVENTAKKIADKIKVVD